MPLPVHIRSHAAVDVVTLGENSLDFVARLAAPATGAPKQELSEFRLQPGGQMATAALACARLGLRTRYVGAFGDDEWGRRARAPLDAAGVEVIAASRVMVPGRIAMILVSSDGDRVVYEHRDRALYLAPEEVTPAMVEDSRVLLVDATHIDASIRAAQIARRANTITVVDVDRASADVDRLLAEIDIVVVPQPFVTDATGLADLRTGMVALAARCLHASILIVTRGDAGVVALCDGQFVEVPAFAVDVVDTTGAGDAFRAGLAVALITLSPAVSLRDVLRFASAVAALNCRAVGAQAGLPTLAEVRDHLARAVQ